MSGFCAPVLIYLKSLAFYWKWSSFLQVWDQTNRRRVGEIHTFADGPWVASGAVVSDEHIEMFLRLVSDASLTIFRRQQLGLCMLCALHARKKVWICAFSCLGDGQRDAASVGKQDMNKQTDEWFDTKTVRDRNRLNGEKVVGEAPLERLLLFFWWCEESLLCVKLTHKLLSRQPESLFCIYGCISILSAPFSLLSLPPGHVLPRPLQ